MIARFHAQDGLMVASAAAVYGAATHDYALMAAFIFAALMPLLVRRRVALTVVSQLALGGVCIAVVLLARGTGAAEADARLGYPLDVAALLALVLALPRLYMKAPWEGPRTTFTLCALCFMAAGYARLGHLYTVLLLSFVLSGVRAMWRDKHRRTTQRDRRGAWMIAAGAGLVATLSAVSLLWLADWANRYMLEYTTRDRIGFGTELVLGSLSGLLESDELVLRVRGPPPTHLRGMVYSRYVRSAWLPPARAASDPLRLKQGVWPLRPDARTTEVEPVGRERSHYFVPLRARGLRVNADEAQGTALGVLLPAEGTEAGSVRFRSGTRDALRIAGPSELDTNVPRRLKPRLHAIAAEWTQGQGTDKARLAALQHTFQTQFTYSTRVERTEHADPVLDFLERSRAGHCEYFASGFALLARSLGIPARVVGGYRVNEYNPRAGYHVVRQRDAHAWVEVWREGVGWVTYDPTTSQPGTGSKRTTGWLRGLGDVFSTSAREAMAFVRSMSPADWAAGILLLAAYWAGLRYVRARRSRRAARALTPEGGFTPPLASLEPLLDTLAKAGHARRASEPLESFASRLRAEPEQERERAAVLQQAAQLLREYAAYRYGGRGEPEPLEHAMRQLSQRLAE